MFIKNKYNNFAIKKKTYNLYDFALFSIFFCAFKIIDVSLFLGFFFSFFLCYYRTRLFLDAFEFFAKFLFLFERETNTSSFDDWRKPFEGRLKFYIFIHTNFDFLVDYRIFCYNLMTNLPFFGFLPDSPRLWFAHWHRIFYRIFFIFLLRFRIRARCDLFGFRQIFPWFPWNYNFLVHHY